MRVLPNTAILFSFILMLFPLAAQDDPGINFTDEDGNRQGYWEQIYANGNIRYKGKFINDRPVGEFLRYFPSGSKMALMFFCDEGLRADAKLFYEDGNLAAEGVYINEKKDSVWKYFSFYDQHLTSARTYSNGLKDGISTIYFPNGNIAETYTYRNDLRHGPWKQYYTDGSLKVVSEFENDLRSGEFVFYSPNGQKEITGNYYKNRMHGEWVFYDGTGGVISKISYIDGVAENEAELIEKQQEEFMIIEGMRGKIPEPDESDLFFPGGRR